jgi:hypothetical protein
MIFILGRSLGFVAYNTFKTKKMASEKTKIQHVEVSANTLFNAILDQCIRNQAMLEIVLSNQADIMSELNSEKNSDEHYKQSMELVSEAAERLKITVFSGMKGGPLG